MNWEEECYLLSKKKFRENANIINVSRSKGKISGVVYGEILENKKLFTII